MVRKSKILHIWVFMVLWFDKNNIIDNVLQTKSFEYLSPNFISYLFLSRRYLIYFSSIPKMLVREVSLQGLHVYEAIIRSWKILRASISMVKPEDTYHNILYEPKCVYQLKYLCHNFLHMGFPGGSASKESTYKEGKLGLIPGLGRSPGEGKGYPLQHSGLENSMGCIVHGVAKSRTRLGDFHFHVSCSIWWLRINDASQEFHSVMFSISGPLARLF